MRIAAVVLSLLRMSEASAQQSASRDLAQLVELGYQGQEAAEKAAKSSGKCAGAADDRLLYGTVPKEWLLADWVNGGPLSLAKLRGRVVVVRFWTKGCAFCEKSMPALQTLAGELGDQPVTFIGAFHAKPADSVADMSEPAKVAKQWGITFPLAFDRDWRTLRSWYLDGNHRHATSVTFVIGKDGRVVHIHPGPVFYPSTTDADANRDYLAVRNAIRTALAR